MMNCWLNEMNKANQHNPRTFFVRVFYLHHKRMKIEPNINNIQIDLLFKEFPNEAKIIEKKLTTPYKILKGLKINI